MIELVGSSHRKWIHVRLYTEHNNRRC